jgi:hypothetical protein
MTVNTNPPEQSTIFYRRNDAELSEHLQQDWVLDTNRIKGMTEMVGFWVAAIFIVVVYPAYMKSRKGVRPGIPVPKE